MKTKILRAYKMANGGGVTKNQPVKPAEREQEHIGLLHYLADVVEMITNDSESLQSTAAALQKISRLNRQIANHLTLMDQTLAGIAGDIAQINTRQLTAFEIIQASAGRIEVTDINDIETPFEDQPESKKAVTSSNIDQVTKEKY